MTFSCLLRYSQSARVGNCFPYDALNENSADICEGDFVSLYYKQKDNKEKYLSIKQQPEPGTCDYIPSREICKTNIDS